MANDLPDPPRATPPHVPSHEDEARSRSHHPSHRSEERIGRVVAGSLVGGFLAAVLLGVAPFTPPTETAVTGAVLCGWALGWALLAVLSVRLTDQPQRWAWGLALPLGASGVLLVTLGSSAHRVLTSVWPPAVLGLVVWSVVRVRRRLRSPTRRWLLYPVLAALALASVGGGLQTVREVAHKEAHPMPGRLISVGGHRLHLSCTGAGSPTVVVEPGAGMVSSQVGSIAAAVAPHTRVCVYDRAGRGWSEPARTPQDARQVATDLRTVLHRGGVPGPYVLAGHSFGGLYALTFAARHPEEVAGMVLVDSTAPASTPGPETPPPADGGSDDLARRLPALASASGRLGLGRLVGVPTASHLGSVTDEYLQGSASMEQAGSLRDLGDKPLVVLTAGTGAAPGWSEQQEALASLSTASAHRVVEEVDHEGLILDEPGAAATARAVLDVVSSVRSGGSLPP